MQINAEGWVNVVDLASIIGLLICLAMVFVGIITSGGIGSFGGYIDLPSIAITFGGSFACILASYTFSEFVAGIKSFGLMFKLPTSNTSEMIKKIIELSNVARKEGLLSLEEASAEIDDAFLKKGILLIVDGTDPELVRAIMETELISVEDRHKAKISFWENVGTMGPAWGMIGTLVGLVNMLNNMNDPGSIGPSMATALVTTLYGSLLANWICAPCANKLKNNNSKELMDKEIMIEGILSIQAGENPRVIEEKLKSFLSPSDRTMENDGGEIDG